MSHKPEVIADSSGKWVGNACRFETVEQADAYNLDLAWRWTSVRQSRVIEVDDPVSYRWDFEARKAVAL